MATPENIHQIYIGNPITSNVSSDLMYFGQSPYGITNDAAMTFVNFAAQFSPVKMCIRDRNNRIPFLQRSVYGGF